MDSVTQEIQLVINVQILVDVPSSQQGNFTTSPVKRSACWKACLVSLSVSLLTKQSFESEHSPYRILSGFSGKAQGMSGQHCLVTLHGAGRQFCAHKGVTVNSHEIVTQVKGLRETVPFLMLFIEVNK